MFNLISVCCRSHAARRYRGRKFGEPAFAREIVQRGVARTSST